MLSHFILSPLDPFEISSLIGLSTPILDYLNLSITNLALIYKIKKINILSFLFLYLSIFIYSFIFQLLAFYFILSGYLGIFFKKKLLEKIKINDFFWFNKFLINFVLLYLIIVFFNSTFYLDSPTIVNCNIDGVTVKGEYIEKIFTHFGAASAFIIGSRLAAGFLSKHTMSILGKIGTIAGSGGISSASFHKVNYTAGTIRGIISGQTTSDNSKNIHIKEVQISSDLNLNNSVDLSKLNVESLANKHILIPNFINKFEGKFHCTPSTNNSKSKTIELLEQTKDQSISEIFAQDNTTIIEKINNSIINSPLESNDLGVTQSQLFSDLTTILSYNLTVNLFMIYLISVLIFAFTVRFVIDNNLLLDKVKSLPLGKYIHYILNKILNIWRDSNILWIYFILFFLFIFSCSSSYAIYGCLFILENLS
jgi:hypothetical protein